MGTSFTSSPSTTRAVLGCRPISERMAEAVLFFARDSIRRPVSTNVMIMTEASNHVSHLMPRAPQNSSPQNVLKTEKRNEMPVDMATSVSMLAEP